ncbi:MAG: hypothetical protein ACLFQV_12880 [Vulcanimicrobiota bacterium]
MKDYSDLKKVARAWTERNMAVEEIRASSRILLYIILSAFLITVYLYYEEGNLSGAFSFVIPLFFINNVVKPIKLKKEADLKLQQFSSEEIAKVQKAMKEVLEIKVTDPNLIQVQERTDDNRNASFKNYENRGIWCIAFLEASVVLFSPYGNRFLVAKPENFKIFVELKGTKMLGVIQGKLVINGYSLIFEPIGSTVDKLRNLKKESGGFLYNIKIDQKLAEKLWKN